MKKNNKNNNTEKALAISAGLAAVVAAGYFFLGPKGKKNIKTTRGWMIKMKGEIVEKMESIKDLTENDYNNIVDATAKAYMSSGGPEEVAKLAKELKSHWKAISSKGIPKGKKKKK